MKNGITGFILFVTDLKKCGTFYQNMLGFKKVVSKRFSEKEWLEFDAGGCKLGLHYSPKPGSFQNNWNKFVLYSGQVAKRREELVKKGVKIGEVVRFDDIEICDGEDPEGNRFQISNHEFSRPKLKRRPKASVRLKPKKGRN
jgi:predicted enzyme related to lactoylglutathione lyase